MRGTWTRLLPRETAEEQREIITYADSCGFDTVIIPNPTRPMIDEGSRRGVDVLAIVGTGANDDIREEHPEAIQQMRPVEQAVKQVLDDQDEYQPTYDAFRWYPPFVPGNRLCYAHPEAESLLEQRIEEALSIADGVALDAVGYQNHYACFCATCRARREAKRTKTAAEVTDRDLLAQDAEELLIDSVDHLYSFSKSISSNAIVTNHVWPPFRPNERYSHQLSLDYNSPTIAWYYPPWWSAERVEQEAVMHATQEESASSSFLPFIGMKSEPELKRSPEQLQAELEIGLEYGAGDVVFSRLETAATFPDIEDVVREALR